MEALPVKIQTLGRFAIEIGGTPLRFKGKAPGKPLELLKVLIAMGGEEVATERLKEALWPDSDGDRAHSAFSTNLARLRKLIGADCLLVQDGRLTLDEQHCWVDAQAVADAIRELGIALADEWSDEAWGPLNELMDLYRGPFLDGEYDPPEVLSTRERLHGQFLRNVGKAGRLLFDGGHTSQAIELFQRGLELDDLAEEMYRNLMQCFLAEGRSMEGVATYKRCQRVFDASVGIVPSPETEAVYQKILALQQEQTNRAKDAAEERGGAVPSPQGAVPDEPPNEAPGADQAGTFPAALVQPAQAHGQSASGTILDSIQAAVPSGAPAPSPPLGSPEGDAGTGFFPAMTDSMAQRATASVAATSISPTPASPIDPPWQQPEPAPNPPLLEDTLGERRIVTVAFLDLTGYSRLGEELDPEEMVEYMGWVRREAARVIGNYGGTINQYLGDGILAVFGVPTSHEDDPLRAVRAAMELNDSLRSRQPPMRHALEFPPRLHTGINTGLVVTNPEQFRANNLAVTGNTVNVAARLADMAGPEEILIGPQTRQAVESFFTLEDLDPVVPRGATQTLVPSKVIGPSDVQTRIQAASARGLTAFTGRSAELAQLHICLDKLRAGEGQLVSVIGDPGMGKSRLLHEFSRSLNREEFTVLECHAHSYGVNRPYMPFRDGLRKGVGINVGMQPREMAQRLVENIQNRLPELAPFIPYYLRLLSLEHESHPLPPKLSDEALRLAYQNALAAICIQGSHHRPIVLILEDWQWADDASMATLNMVVEMMSAHPLLLIITARPEFKPQWGHLSFHTQVVLRPLDLGQVSDLLCSILKVERISEKMLRLGHDRSGGNPFFLEEMCRTLLEDGSLREVGPGKLEWTRPLNETTLPTSIQALIRTRVDHLEEEDRKVLRLAAVIGREFRQTVMERMLSDQVGLRASLARLTSLELLQQTSFLPEARYRFRHVLTQVVVYETMLLQQRRKLHEVVGNTLETVYADQLEQWFESLAYHYSRSNATEKAVYYLTRAGEKAANYYSLANARRYYRDVLHHLQDLPETTPEYQRQFVEMALKWSEVSYYAPADETIQTLRKAAEMANSLGDMSLFLRCRYWEGRMLSVFGYTQESVSVYEDSLALAVQLRHKELITRITNSLGRVGAHTGEYQKGLEYLERGIPMMLELGDLAEWTFSLRFQARILGTLGRFDQAQDLMATAIDKAQAVGNLTQQAGGMADLAWVLILKGEWEQAIAQAEQAMEIARETDNHHIVSQCMVIKGNGLFKMGQEAKGLETMREGMPTADFPLPVGAITFLAWMLENLLQSGDLDATSKALQDIKRIHKLSMAGSGDITLARVEAQLALLGEPSDEAAMRKHMEHSISTAREREALPDLAISCLQYGRMLLSLRHVDEARRWIEEALERFQTLGMASWPERAKALLDELPRRKQ